MEQKSDAYHARVREGFLKLGDLNDKVKIVDARQTVEQVHEAVLRYAKEI